MLVIQPHLPLPQARTAYESSVIVFCKKWLSGQSKFAVQTSGSTGKPKTIFLSRKQMQTSAKLTAKTFGLESHTVALVCLNIHYIAGLMMLVRGLEIGMELWVVEPSANPLQKLAIEQSIAFMAVVPLQLETMLGQSSEKLKKIQTMIVGGTSISKGLEEEVAKMPFTSVFATYGMTETATHIAIRPLNGGNSSDFFEALNGVELDIDNRNCLKIRGEVTNFRWVKTNDVVEMVKNKNPIQFKILGRADDVINSGGVKIQPTLVEEKMRKFMLNFRFFVVGITDAILGQQVALVIESVNEIPDLPQKLTSVLMRYEIPKKIIYKPLFAETPTGKIDKPTTIKCIN